MRSPSVRLDFEGPTIPFGNIKARKSTRTYGLSKLREFVELKILEHLCYTPSILLLLHVHIRLPMVNVELYNISYISFNSNFLYCWANYYTATKKTNTKKEMGRKGDGGNFLFLSYNKRPFGVMKS